uniref:PBPe domain-containing protein n=1 Tax=Macrostomum lignano TaxID=282301 RepID=A0A1I8JQI1_9PLAT
MANRQMPRLIAAADSRKSRPGAELGRVCVGSAIYSGLKLFLQARSMLAKCNADLRSLLALGAIVLTSGIALATAAATAGRVEWRFHAWNPKSAAKIDLPNSTAVLPDSEELALAEICRAVSSLPPDAHLLAVSGSGFHPALNSFCLAFNVTCIFLDALEGERVPDDWLHNAIASSRRQSCAADRFLITSFGRYAAQLPLGPVLFRPLDMSRPSKALYQLHRLKRSTLHRFVVDMPIRSLPNFFKLLSEAFFGRHVAPRLNNGVNFTTHQLGGVRSSARASIAFGAVAQRSSAGSGVPATQARFQSKIRNRLGVVLLDGAKYYNFSFVVRHMSRHEFAEWNLDRGYRVTRVGSNMEEQHYKRSMSGLNLTVATVIDPPFSLERDFDAGGNRLIGNQRWTGMAIEFYTIQVSSDGQFGSPKLNEAGEQVVDFTTPFMGLGLSVIMKKPEQQTDPLQFMLPFSGRVWTCMLLAWLLTSLLMLVCARLSPYEWYSHNDCVPVVENQFGALNSMWFTIGSLMQQDRAAQCSDLMHNRIGPHQFFLLSKLQDRAGAQGLLDEDGCDNLLLTRPTWPLFSPPSRLGTIDSVEALASQSKVKFGCPIGGAMYKLLQDCVSQGGAAVRSFFSCHKEQFIEDIVECLDQACGFQPDRATVCSEARGRCISDRHHGSGGPSGGVLSSPPDDRTWRVAVLLCFVRTAMALSRTLGPENPGVLALWWLPPIPPTAGRPRSHGRAAAPAVSCLEQAACGFLFDVAAASIFSGLSAGASSTGRPTGVARGAGRNENRQVNGARTRSLDARLSTSLRRVGFL